MAHFDVLVSTSAEIHLQPAVVDGDVHHFTSGVHRAIHNPVPNQEVWVWLQEGPLRLGLMSPEIPAPFLWGGIIMA